MKNWVKLAILNKKISLFLAVLVMSMGIFYYYFLPRQEYPEIISPVAMVSVIYPGASPDQVEELVTREIEREVSELDGYDYCFSYSYNSASTSFVRLKYGTDIEKAWRQLRDQMNDLQSELPPECQKIEIHTDLVDTMGMMISMSGENYSSEELFSYAQGLRESLEKVPGIAKFDIVGKQDKIVKITLNLELLNRLSVSVTDILQLIQMQNVSIPVGALEVNQSSIQMNIGSKFERLDQLRDLVVQGSPSTGAVTRLKDIAVVEMADTDLNYKIKYNGKNAVLLVGQFQKGNNIVLTGKIIEEYIKAYKTQLPKDIAFNEVLFQPTTVEKSVNSFIFNLMQGVAFVVIVVLLGMGVRNAFIVSTALPLSILATFIFMKGFNIPLHQISIAALIVALGMVVDNAIVIIDAIQVKLDGGLNRLDACIEGAGEVAVPILTSTLTTVVAFLPLLMLPSIAGEYIKSLPAIVIVSLSVSFLVALLITPTMSFLLLKPSQPKIEKHIIRRFFDKALLVALKHRKAVSLIVIVLLVATGWIGMNIGLKFFPYAESDMIYVDLKAERSNDFKETEKLVAIVDEILRQNKSIIEVTSAIGGGLPKFYNTLNITPPSNDAAQMMLKVDLSTIGSRKKYNQLNDLIIELQAAIDQSVTNGTVTVKQLEQAEPIGAPIRLRVIGDDIDRLGEQSELLKAILQKLNGTKNVSTDFNSRQFEYLMEPDALKMDYLGITAYDMQNQLSIALRGRVAGQMRLSEDVYDMKLTSNMKSLTEIENFAVKSSLTGQKAALREFSEIKSSRVHPVIKKYKKQIAVHVFSDVSSGYSSSEIVTAMKAELLANPIPDLKYVLDGEQEKINENFGNIGESGIFAFAFVFVILLFQFKNFKQPLIIILTIPLSVIGSLMGLYFTGQDLSFMALLGIVSLMGIVVNNAIVLVDFINLELKQGKSKTEACIDAVDKRFRPIMLTTVTTVIGFIPLFLTGSTLFIPMATAIMSGLIVSTLLTLVIIPMVVDWTYKSEH